MAKNNNDNTRASQMFKRQQAIEECGPCPCGCRSFDSCALYNNDVWVEFAREHLGVEVDPIEIQFNRWLKKVGGLR